MSIGQRIAVLVVAAVVVGMSIYGGYNVRARRAELLSYAQEESEELGGALDVALNDMLSHRELQDMSHLPEALNRAQPGATLLLFDARSNSAITPPGMIWSSREVQQIAREAVSARRVVRREIHTGNHWTIAHAFPLWHDGQVVGAGVALRDLAYIEDLLRKSRDRIIGAGLIVAFLVVVTTLLGARAWLGTPVSVLIEGVRRIGEGDLSRPIPVQRRDEIGRVAAALNQMTQDLESAREQIARDLEQRIALKKSVEFERRLQHAQRLAAVGQVAASLAHEIGSPLHVIAGRARFAAGREDPKEMRENLLTIASQADRITKVVEQMLSIARRRRARSERVQLATIGTTVVELLSPQARQQSVKLALREETPGLATTGNADGLQQVLFNLVLNAVQAQPNGGEVEVVLLSAEEPDSLGTPRPRAVIEVRDRGPGVPESQREAIFEPFATGRESSGGTGLGLAVVREIAREHNGSVRVLERAGGGAVFRVSLALDDDGPTEARA